MAYIFEDWKTLLEKFQKCVDQGVEEMHQQKAEVQQIKKEIFNRLDSGNIIRDDRRIVLSAPEIIIGNVDKGGTLKEETGSVIVRGHHLALEGAGESGSVITRAPLIEQKAVNPGIDGRENVVSNTSQIVSQACSIMLHSSDATDEFSQIPSHPGRGGISIHADSQLDFEAAVSAENRKKQIEDTLTALDKQSGYLKSSMTDQKSSVDKFISEMVKLAEKEDKLNETDNYETFVNLSEIDALHSEMDELMPALLRSIQGFIDTVSELAEVNRRKKALKAEKDKIKTGDDFKKKTTGAQMSIKAEAITVATADGDGNLHTNGEAGIRVRTPRMSMSMHDDKGALVEDGYFNVSAHDININTANPKDNDWPVEGKINIWSKEVSIEAIDYKKNDKDVLMEKELTKDGSVDRQPEGCGARREGQAHQGRIYRRRRGDHQVEERQHRGYGLRGEGRQAESEGADQGQQGHHPRREAADHRCRRRGQGHGKHRHQCEGGQREVDGRRQGEAHRQRPGLGQHDDPRSGEDVRGPEDEEREEQEAATRRRGTGCFRRQDPGDTAGRRQGRGAALRRQRLDGRQQVANLRRHHYQRQGRHQGRREGPEGCLRQPRGQEFLQVSEHQRRHRHPRCSGRWQSERKAEDGGCTERLNIEH